MLLTSARNAAGARFSSIRRGQQLEDIAHRHRIYERVAFLLGMICAIGPISTDIYICPPSRRLSIPSTSHQEVPG
ncbi:MAG: hypothetical protein AAYR33_08710 [Acetobacteraceae bacterium]